MAEMRHDHEEKPVQMVQTHDTRPPKLPDKIPITLPFDIHDPRAIIIPNLRLPLVGPDGILTASDPVDTALNGSDIFYRDQSQRQSQSQNNVDISRPSFAAAASAHTSPTEPVTTTAAVAATAATPAVQTRSREEERLAREMESLRQQLKDANNRADQAERAAEELEYRLKAGFEGVVSGHASLTNTVEALALENKDLKAELDDARSHIFSLQPYRKDLTPEEVGRDYDDLVNGITDWATKFVDPILANPERLDDILAAAKKRPSDIQRLRKFMHSSGDLVNACMFPETDVDVAISITMRFLFDNIFQKIIFGALPNVVELLGIMEASMQNNVEPKRDLFALRSWRAEALTAVICSPDYQRAKATRMRDLTIELSSMFRMFRRDKEWNRSLYSCQENVIRPAIDFHEKLLTSTHHFYLDLNPYMVWNSRQELETSPDFLDSLHKLKCENILQNRKPFNVAKLNPRPSKEQLCMELTHVLSVVPAIYMRQIGKGDSIKEPTIVRMQQVLVAWGGQERREKFAANNSERTIMNRLYYISREKQERAHEGLLSPWRSIAWP